MDYSYRLECAFRGSDARVLAALGDRFWGGGMLSAVAGQARGLDLDTLWGEPVTVPFWTGDSATLK
jgi:hypothetical protein